MAGSRPLHAPGLGRAGPALERGARVDAAHALLDDDALIDQVLTQVRARMGEDDEAPDPPSEEYGWYAYSPGRRAR